MTYSVRGRCSGAYTGDAAPVQERTDAISEPRQPTRPEASITRTRSNDEHAMARRHAVRSELTSSRRRVSAVTVLESYGHGHPSRAARASRSARMGRSARV
jgi:hypothetical protein